VGLLLGMAECISPPYSDESNGIFGVIFSGRFVAFQLFARC